MALEEMANQNGCGNTHSCPCPGVKCSNHGKCCECIVKHKAAGNVPYCLRDTVNAMVERLLKQREE